MGGLYERQLDTNTVLTIEADYDVKDINQTFTQITDNVNPNYKNYVDLRHNGRLSSMPLQSYVGFFINNMEQEGQTFTNLDDFHGTRGTLAQNNRGTVQNIGGRFREELEFVPKWILAAGFGFEQSMLAFKRLTIMGPALSPAEPTPSAPSGIMRLRCRLAGNRPTVTAIGFAHRLGMAFPHSEI